MKILTLLLVFFSSLSVYSQRIDFPDNYNYRRNVINPEKDSFCPRLEGSHPDHCCPYKEKGPRTCYYFRISSVGVGTNSQATSCVNGENTQVDCCNRGQPSCVSDIVTKQFIQRLIKRPYPSPNSSTKVCGFEACPLPQYWKYDNLIDRSVANTDPSANLCNVVAQQDQCYNSGLPSCGNLSACAVPVIPVDPGGGVTPPTGGGGGGGTTPIVEPPTTEPTKPIEEKPKYDTPLIPG